MVGNGCAAGQLYEVSKFQEIQSAESAQFAKEVALESSSEHGVSGPTAAQHARPCIESLAVESTAADPQVEAAANCKLVSRYCDWSSAFDLLLFISSKTVLVIKKVNEPLTGGTAFRRRRLATRARSDNRRLSINRSNLAGSGS